MADERPKLKVTLGGEDLRGIDLSDPPEITQEDRDFWQHQALRTDPIDREAAYESICNFYRRLDYQKMPTPYYYDSPWDAMEDYLSLLKRDPPSRLLPYGRQPADDILELFYTKGASNVPGARELAQRVGTNILELFYTMRGVVKPRLVIGGAWAATRSLIKEEGTLRTLCTEQARHCNLWFPYNDVVLICERPKVIRVDDEGRLHRDDGPAVVWRGDAHQAFFWHGIQCPAAYIVHEPTRWMIQNEKNTELRRVLLERLTHEEAVRQGIFRFVSRDEYGELYIDDIGEDRMGFMQHNMYVRVKNSSPEPDGTYKYYILQVPPDSESAKEGVAATFGIMPNTRHTRHFIRTRDHTTVISGAAIYDPKIQT